MLEVGVTLQTEDIFKDRLLISGQVFLHRRYRRSGGRQDSS